MVLKDVLISKYWLFKQFSPLADLNLYFYYILYELLRPRFFQVPTLEVFNNNLYRKGDYEIYYTKERIKFIRIIGVFLNLPKELVGFDDDFGIEAEFGFLDVTTFDLDFENSLIRKNDIFLKSGSKECYGYKIDSIFGIL